jgi:hypothetical protein
MEEQIQITPQPKKKFRKFKRAFVILLSLFLVVIISGIVLANVYEKEIKRYAIDEINTHLKAKLKINEENVSFSFFKKFPSASLNFANILIEDENQKDTILFAKNFSLEFGLGSIFSGDYSVKEMDLDNARVNLHVDEKGNENYIFWKEDKSKDTTETKFNFALKQLNLNDVFLIYQNDKSKILVDLTIRETTFGGNFSSDTSDLTISSDHFINQFSSDSTIYFKDKNSLLSIEKGIFTSDYISLSKGQISIEEMELGVNGNFDLKNDNSDISALARNVEISQIFSLMPESFREKLTEYRTKGKINGSVVIENNQKWKSPKIEAKFLVKQGTITEQNSGVELKDLNLSGNFESSQSSQRIELIDGSGNLSGGKFSITGKMIGKNTHTIFSKINGDFDLQKLGEFLNLDGIEKMSGSLNLNNEFRGTLNQNGDMKVSEFLGEAILKDVLLKLEGAEGQFQEFTGEVNFNRFNSSATAIGKYGNSDLNISTQFTNFIPYLVNNEQLTANIYLQSELLELDKLLANDKKEVESGIDTNGVEFPKRVKANLRTTITKLTYQNHELTNVSGEVEVMENQVRTSNLIFNSNSGNYSLSGDLKKKADGFTLASKIICGQVDISDLLKKFNNFGQSTLRHDHLSGRANAIISFNSKTSKHLELDLNSLEADMEFSIAEGVLRNLELFDEIGEYLKGNVISRNIIKVDDLAKKLKTVEFSKFTNTINIKNRMITIPSMSLSTSAMDIGIYGTQSFDYDINYGMNLRLKDILTKKKDTEYGYIVDDGEGVRLFLLMTGTIDEPEFKLDKASKKEYQEKQREAEKQNVKGILKDEFGLFGKDSTAKKAAEQQKAKPKFEVEWGEEGDDKSDKKTDKKEDEKPEKEKKKRKWLDKLKGNEEKKDKTKFEIE